MTDFAHTSQRDAFARGDLPELEEVAESIWSLPAQMSGSRTGLRYSLTYVILDGKGQAHVFDPGEASEKNWLALRAALDSIRPGVGVGSVAVTHHHQDHFGLAPRVAEEYGAPLIMHEADAEALGVNAGATVAELTRLGAPADVIPDHATAPGPRPGPARAPDHLLKDRSTVLDIPGLRVEALHTPGHSAGHLCFHVPDRGVMLTGDHILPQIYPGIGLGGRFDGNPVAAYLDSLELVSQFADCEVLPGHQYRFPGLGERATQIRVHLEKRAEEVKTIAARTGDSTVYQIAAQLSWSAGWDVVREKFLVSALRQTAMHLALE